MLRILTVLLLASVTVLLLANTAHADMRVHVLDGTAGIITVTPDQVPYFAWAANANGDMQQIVVTA